VKPVRVAPRRRRVGLDPSSRRPRGARHGRASPRDACGRRLERTPRTLLAGRRRSVSTAGREARTTSREARSGPRVVSRSAAVISRIIGVPPGLGLLEIISRYENNLW
jgi:hypothetical protein